MEFNTGDIALFSGTYEQHKRVQKFINSMWSQVAMLINWNGRMAVFESTKVPICWDVERNECVSGVQIVWFEEKISAFEGTIAIRKLQPTLSRQKQIELLKFVREVKGKPYNDNKYFMVRGREKRNPLGDGSTFICSQLVAEALQKCGVLKSPPFGLASTNYSPADFSSGNFLPFLNSFSFSEEVIVKQIL